MDARTDEWGRDGYFYAVACMGVPVDFHEVFARHTMTDTRTHVHMQIANQAHLCLFVCVISVGRVDAGSFGSVISLASLDLFTSL